MKVYEESVGDRLARLKGGKLQLSVVLRLCSCDILFLVSHTMLI